MNIERISRISRILDAVRYGFPSGTNPVYSEKITARKEDNLSRTDVVRPVLALAMSNYTKDATKEDYKGRLIDRIA